MLVNLVHARKVRKDNLADVFKVHELSSDKLLKEKERIMGMVKNKRSLKRPRDKD